MAYLQLLEDPYNPKYDTFFFINMPTECEMCFIFEENFVRKISVDW